MLVTKFFRLKSDESCSQRTQDLEVDRVTVLREEHFSQDLSVDEVVQRVETGHKLVDSDDGGKASK